MDLTGKLLIAMPGMGDPRFDHAVVLICSHSDDGAMGLIVNKPAPGVSFAELLEQLEIADTRTGEDALVRFGGPVEGSRGFVLHGQDYASSLQTMKIGSEFAMTATLDILEDIAAGEGPAHWSMMLGYSGWGAGQLEGEIGQNAWLTVDASPQLIFDLADDEKWTAALALLGVDPLGLSAEAGHA